MSSSTDSQRMDAELAAFDAEQKRRLEEAKDFACRLNAAGKAFEDAYADLQRADTQLRQGRIDWHFVLITLNAKAKEANADIRFHERDRFADPIINPLQSVLLRMVASADESKQVHEAVTLIKARSEAEQNIIRNLALEARQNLYYDLGEAVALRVVDSFPETFSEARTKYIVALDAHLIGQCDDWFRNALFQALDGAPVARMEVEAELERLSGYDWVALVRALLDAHPNPMTTAKLTEATGVSDPGGGLARARDKSPLLQRIIVMPGAGRKGGYRLQHITR